MGGVATSVHPGAGPLMFFGAPLFHEPARGTACPMVRLIRMTLEFGRFALVAVIVGAGSAPAAAQTVAPSLLARRYLVGDSVHYAMVASNQGRTETLRYSARADGVVSKDSLGRFVEDLEWSHLTRDGAAVALPAGTAAVRQRVSLAPEVMLPPDVAHGDPRLVGPVLDLFTFYVDLWLAAKMPLARPGDHVRFPRNTPNSWADRRYVILGEDAIDFEITLLSIDSASGRAKLQVRHVPPATAVVHPPVTWMQAPLFDTPNNWVQVEKSSDTSYVAGVGRESFDVQIDVRLADGSILAATMDNPVDVMERVCRDVALTLCSEPRRYRILRRISLEAR